MCAGLPMASTRKDKFASADLVSCEDLGAWGGRREVFQSKGKAGSRQDVGDRARILQDPWVAQIRLHC